MKLKSLYVGAIALVAVSLTSCSDWFDVSAKTDVKAEELFETAGGFESALAGIYISMTDEDSYGHDLSFGLMDQLAQLYDRVPDGTTILHGMGRSRTATTPSRAWPPSG